MSYSIPAAIRKYHRLGGLNNRILFLMVLEAENFKIKVAADSAPGETSFPGLPGGFLLLSHMGDIYRERERREKSIVSPSS